MSWLAGAWVSYNYVTSSWIPGLVFGTVVLIWHWSFSGAVSAVRCALFVVASVLNYALVIAIAEAGAPGSLNFNAFEPSVVVGSILLPIAHGVLLGITAKRVIVAIPVIYLVAYVVASAVDVSGPAVSIVNPVSAWQLAYLLLIRPRYAAQPVTH
ncbi:MAG: hypothetical protein ACR2QQ_09035 [Gammaproteobacteria bacterium]